MALNRMNFSNATLGKQLMLLLVLFVLAIAVQGILVYGYSAVTTVDEQQGVNELYSAADSVVNNLDLSDVNAAHLEVARKSKEIGATISPEIKNYFLFMQMGYNILCFLVVGLVYRWLVNSEKKVMPDLNVRNPFLLFVSVFLLLAALPLLGESIHLNDTLGLNALADQLGFDFTKDGLKQTLLTYSVFSPNGSLEHIIMFLGVAIFPAIGEELFFRGGIQKQLHERGFDPHWTIFITALIFALLHMEFMAFFYRFLLGVLLGYVYFWSGSIWTSIVIHFCNNALTYFSLFVISAEEIPEEVSGQGITFAQLLMSLFSTGLLLYVFYQHYRKNQIEDSIK